MQYKHEKSELAFERYPPTNDKTLRPFSAVDDLLLEQVPESQEGKLVIANDRFGVLSTCLAHHTPTTILTYGSQRKAIFQNLHLNKITDHVMTGIAVRPYPDLSLGLMVAPKSLGLYQWLLASMAKTMQKDGAVHVGFFTRNFTPELVRIAELYFDQVTQSKAVKKARVLTCTGVKPEISLPDLIELEYDGKIWKQYPGVFSAGHIDYGTQFFLENMQPVYDARFVLDLASGNGIIGGTLAQNLPNTEIHLVDDFELAISSSMLNVPNGKSHCADNLDEFQDEFFDYVVSNPPFHFDSEVNTSITAQLFKQVARVLKPGGRFDLVANRHLPYQNVLQHHFKEVRLQQENKKFRIWQAIKG